MSANDELKNETADGTKNVLGEGLIKVEISRVLCGYGWRPFILTCRTHKIKRAYEKWGTLAELKHYYEITKVKKTNKKEWALSGRGKKYEWFVYEAYVDAKFVLEPFT